MLSLLNMKISNRQWISSFEFYILVTRICFGFLIESVVRPLVSFVILSKTFLRLFIILSLTKGLQTDILTIWLARFIREFWIWVKAVIKIKRFITLALTLALFSCLTIPWGGCKKKGQLYQAGAAEKLGLRVLYVGHPGSDREKDFTDFLTPHFELLETGALGSFEENQADNFDVVIFDYDGDAFKAPRPNISPPYSRPTVTIGVIGALICDGQNLKQGYL